MKVWILCVREREKEELQLDLTLLAVLGIVAMIVMIALGVHIGMAMFITGFVGYALATGNLTSAIVTLRTYTFTSAMNYTLSVVPLFVLMGQFVFYAGISDDLFRASRTLFGRTPGGLAYAGIFSCAAFGAICGTLGATTATMCSVAKPIMRDHRYDDRLIGGTLSTGGTLGTLIQYAGHYVRRYGRGVHRKAVRSRSHPRRHHGHLLLRRGIRVDQGQS